MVGVKGCEASYSYKPIGGEDKLPSKKTGETKVAWSPC